MTKSAILEVKEGKTRQAVNSFLKDLFAKNVVEAMLVPLAHPSGTNVVQALISDPSHVDQADVFAPVMPVNSAKILQAMTRLTPVDRKTAIVIRPCEMRAVVELIKLKQIQPANLLFISIDCPGAYSTKDYPKFAAEKKTSDDFVKAGFRWAEDAQLRAGCQICEYPYPLTADITIGMLGLEPGQLLLIADTPRGEEALKTAGFTLETDSATAQKRQAALARFVPEVKERRKKFFEKTKEEIGGIEKLTQVFATCIKCQNCRAACPVCYCRECVFVSPTFELESEKYMRQAVKKGGIRMPADTLLFHLTRMNHMANSCVGCSACEEACPNDIPLLKIFQLTGAEVQELFDYVPGRNVEEPLPAAAFLEKEFQEMGEKK
ncbi:MAG: Coenzyme F420 hydrogenase/dehydrogenase, beta subunit C-terminal domain [Dehalococcoidia bacterium]|nr:Coenzyme F420 hydrogenase/dehydrogenase, beta subunit C-terminal domain [Dehalococcoidia bacterium]